MACRALSLSLARSRARAQVCFRAAVGTVQGPVRTEFGHHLVLVHSRSGDPEPKKSGCG